MGIRNLLARFHGDTLLVFVVAMGVVYALPLYVYVTAGQWPDLLGWAFLAVWGKVGWWLINGVFFGGFNGEPED